MHYHDHRDSYQNAGAKHALLKLGVGKADGVRRSAGPHLAGKLFIPN
jgi:hypothetical protein